MLSPVKIVRLLKILHSYYKIRNPAIAKVIIFWPIFYSLILSTLAILGTIAVRWHFLSDKAIAEVKEIVPREPFYTITLKFIIKDQEFEHTYRYKTSHLKEKIGQKLPIRVILENGNPDVSMRQNYFFEMAITLIAVFMFGHVRRFYRNLIKFRHSMTVPDPNKSH